MLIGKIVDGYWEIVERKKTDKNHAKYVLKNIYNGTTIEIPDKTVSRIVKGKSSVSKWLTKKIRKVQNSWWQGQF